MYHDADSREVYGPRSIEDKTADEWMLTSWYLHYRVLCRNHSCLKSFCKGCGAVPYHEDMDCETYAERMEGSLPCRYCSSRSCAKGSDICHSEVCRQTFREEGCMRSHECGHDCFGCRDERSTECPPCLVAECVEAREARGEKTVNQTREDMCTICSVGSLGSEVCVKLKCGHVFHKECVRQQLDAVCPKDDINFRFWYCCLCGDGTRDTCITHSSLSDQVIEIRSLYQKASCIVYKLVKSDEFTDDVKTLSKEEARSLVWSRVVFKRCGDCNRVYDGGRKECQPSADEMDDFDAALTVSRCEDCQRTFLEESAAAENVGRMGVDEEQLWLETEISSGLSSLELDLGLFIEEMDEKESVQYPPPTQHTPHKQEGKKGRKRHPKQKKQKGSGSTDNIEFGGKVYKTFGDCRKEGHAEMLVWKCRFCCEPALYKCWGSTHFCHFCHENDRIMRGQGRAQGQREREQCHGKGKCPTSFSLKDGQRHNNGTLPSSEKVLFCQECHAADVQEYLEKNAAAREQADNVANEPNGDHTHHHNGKPRSHSVSVKSRSQKQHHSDKWCDKCKGYCSAFSSYKCKCGHYGSAHKDKKSMWF